MTGQRRLNHEALESRRLLAADCQLVDPVHQEVRLANDAGPILDVRGIAHDGIMIDYVGGAPPYPVYSPYSSDLIHEDSDRVFVLDQTFGPSRTLFGFERTDSGGLEQFFETEVNFPVREMFVVGDQVVLIGSDYLAHPAALDVNQDGFITPIDGLPRSQTLVMTVTPSEGTVVVQEFEGHLNQVSRSDGRLVMSSSIHGDFVIAIFPAPPGITLLRSFEISAEGLQETASLEITQGFDPQVRGDDLYVTSIEYPVFFAPTEGDAAGGNGIQAPNEPVTPVTKLTRYSLANGGIEEVDVVELTGGLGGLHIAEDGQTAFAILHQYHGNGPASTVALLSLADDGIQLFQTVELPGLYAQLHAVGQDHALLVNYADSSLLVVDLNQSIDLAAENRVRQVELPTNVWLQYQGVQVNDDLFVISAHRMPIVEDAQLNVPVLPSTVLLTISISEAEVIAESQFENELATPIHWLFSIDSETQRFGFVAERVDGAGQEFVFGHLNDDGQFERDGAIAIDRNWLEIDANADRVLVRTNDQLIEYPWDDVENPIVTPLGHPEPTITANDDVYTLTAGGTEHLLDVLANDLIHHFGFSPHVEIVELIGAPAAAEIVHGRMIRIPGEALADVENLRFEYVISNGQERSSAVVEIDVLQVSEEDVRRIVQAIREQAAEDFDVSFDDVNVTSVERIFGQPLPVVLPNGETIDLSPGVLVLVQTPNATGLYAASLAGRIVQVFASQLEKLAELSLRAVNDNGETLTEIPAGESFWLEFNAQDLRQVGLGVFAAFFDLIVPTEHLIITGPIEYGPGFAGLPGGSFTDGEIDDLGAFSDEIDPPGADQQMIMRIAVQAVGAGQVTLQPEPADAEGTQTLLRGENTELSPESVHYRPLALTILEESGPDPLDVNGNGEVTASDALVVINFLGEHGTTQLSDLVSGEFSDEDLQLMRRMDTNRSGFISALDALFIVNRLNVVSINQPGGTTDEDGEEDALPADLSATAKIASFK
jgi:Dockerin type I domain